MRRFAGLVLLPIAAASCAGNPGEFDNSGWVAGRVYYIRCVKPHACAAAAIPKRVWNTQSGTGVRGRLVSHQNDPAGIGMGRDGKFGDAPVPTGRWIFYVPRMERRGCAPRPTFEIKAKMFYEIDFRFGRTGHCSATVWEQPVGLQHPDLRHVVARVRGA
jgi:hypothetical protein